MGGLRYLLDTNIISALIRQSQGPLASVVAQRGYGTLCTSIIVASELRFGARKRGSSELSNRVNEILTVVPALPLGLGVDEAYANVRFRLERDGTPIGTNDLLIAAHALSLDLTVVTDNAQEFFRVPALRVENWLAAIGEPGSIS